jgi:xanthine dehydrogenase accessory factor
VRAPVGLPIHSHTPEEIAISIAAEIIQEKNRSS